MPQLDPSRASQPPACGAAKAAVRSFARSWTRPQRPPDSVNGQPGTIPTPGYDLGLSEEQLKEFVDSQARYPVGTSWHAREIAKAVVFLFR